MFHTDTLVSSKLSVNPIQSSSLSITSSKEANGNVSQRFFRISTTPRRFFWLHCRLWFKKISPTLLSSQVKQQVFTESPPKKRRPVASLSLWATEYCPRRRGRSPKRRHVLIYGRSLSARQKRRVSNEQRCQWEELRGHTVSPRDYVVSHEGSAEL